MSGPVSARVDAFVDRLRHHRQIPGIALAVVGNTLTGKSDGEVFFEFYRKDGTLTLKEGSDLTKGKWTIEGEKVCFKYPDEDKDCFTVSRTAEQVTLGGGKGKGLRLTLLPGNPKDL